MRTLVEYLPEHPFFAGLDPAAMELVVGCAQNVHFARATCCSAPASRPTRST